MKLTRINTLLVAILISLAAMVKGQTNYPVFVTTTLTPPYSVNLGDYSKFGSQQLLVNIRVNDLTVVNLPVKLQIKIEGVGISIFNLPTINTTPIYLNGGDNTMLSGNDFANYLSVNNLAFKGYSKEIYKRTGQIPDGFYRFSITVLHYSTNRIISNEASYSAWIVAGKPVNLLKPTDKEIVGDNDGVPILFSWEPSLVGSPAAKGNIQYKFEMWEMRIKGVNPYTIAASMPAVHEYTTFGTTYLLNPAGLLMEPTMQYCWRVTASDITGNVFFEKDGKSEVRVFTYQSPCDAVTQLTGKAISTTAVFQWVPQMNHTAFITHILNPQTGWESTSETYDSKVQFYDLEPGSTYQLKVQSVCGSTYQRKSRYSNIAEVTINPQRAIIDTACPDCSCNDVLPKKIANTQLRNNVAAGDIITNKSGRTRFVIHSVEQTAPDTYRGVLYFWSEIWGVKIACNYTNLQVNTDNIAVNLKFESIDNPGFVLDVAKAQTLAAAVSNTIKEKLPDKGDFDDTLKVDYNIAAIYINENNEIVAVSADANGTVSESVLNVNQLEHDVLITDKNGQQLVATTGGTIMSNNVYQATKGNAAKVSEYNKKQETENTGSPVVKFSLAPNQLYGFDEYNSQKQRIAIQYPVLTAGYIPPYKSISGFGSDYAIVNNSKNIEFRNELGVPVMCNNGTITVRGNAGGSQGAVYAYAKGDSTNKIIGKLNIQSYDLQTKKVVIVPVNNAAVPLQSELKNTLNTIFKQAVTDWEVSVAEPLNNITFAGGKYTHGGSSSVSTYNTDQKSITRMFESQYGKPDKNTFYLFYLSASDINPTNVIGYMPLKRQIGFIYGSPTLSTVAHELCHGAFNLYHTFSSDNNIAPKGTTKNLMDYNEGSELWKYQWDLIHDPQTMLFAWAQDEEEGQAINLDILIAATNDSDNGLIWSSTEAITCITPAGKPFTLPNNIKTLDFTSATEVFPDGALINFTTTDGKFYSSMFNRANKEFKGYIEIKYPNADLDKDKYDYIDNEKTKPAFLTDNITKTLTNENRVLLGKKINCAINVYQIDYSEVKNKTGISDAGYNGSGTYSDAPLAYNIEGKTAVTVDDNTACLGKYAKEFYTGHKSASSPYKETLLRIANLLSEIEGGGDALFREYELYCNKEGSRRFYGNPDLWGTPTDYALFENALRAFISSKDTLEQLIQNTTDRNKVTDLAWAYLYKYPNTIDNNTRTHILKIISSEAMWGNPLFGGGQEYIALKLVQSVPLTKDDANSFIAILQQDNLMQNLCANIENVGTGENYTKFIAYLTSLFYTAKQEELTTVGNDLDAYANDRSTNDGIYVWFTWRKAFRNDNFNIRYRKSYENNKLVFKQATGYWIDGNKWWTRPALDPFDIVIIEFDDVPEHICESCIAENQIMEMPAFLFEWVCNEYTNQKIVEYISDGITITSFIFGVGALAEGVNTLRVLSLILASGNAVLVVNDFEDFVEENMPEGSLELWTGFSILFDLSNPISTLKNGEALKDFNDFVIVWNLFKETDKYKNLEKSPDNEELILQVNALIEELIISQ